MRFRHLALRPVRKNNGDRNRERNAAPRCGDFEVRQDHNDQLRVAGIVVNQFQARARLPQRVVDELRTEGLPVLEPFLSASVKVRESHEAACPLINLAPRQKLTGEYEALYDSIQLVAG